MLSPDRAPDVRVPGAKGDDRTLDGMAGDLYSSPARVRASGWRHDFADVIRRIVRAG